MRREDMVIILGVDPGSNVTGYGIVNSDGEENTYVESGVIKPANHAALPEKLREIFEGLTKVIEKHHPRQFAIEETFYSKNARSALVMGQARGVAILAASKSGIPVGEYSPKEVKCAVAGTGNAAKSQVQFMVKKLLRLKDPPQPLDASDALAVALCHAQRIRRDARMQAKMSKC